MSNLIDVIGAGETPAISEKVVISPCSGQFRPLPPETFTSDGEWVRRGQVLAEIDDGNRTVPVISLFDGWVMGMLAIAGQPVAERDRLFWIRT